MEEEGIEPSFAGCRPAVLPLNDSPKTWLRAGELNATRMAYEASMTPVHLPAENLVREAGVEPAASRLSIECSNHAELFPVVHPKSGAPCQIRTGFSGVQVRRIAHYAYRASRFWSQWSESNARRLPTMQLLSR